NRVKLPVEPAHLTAIQQHQAELKSLEAELKDAEQKLKSIQNQSSESLVGTVVDDADATKTGHWKASTLFKSFVGVGYVHDDNRNKGDAAIRFATRLSQSGQYEVRVSFSDGSTRASNVPVTVETSAGEQSVVLNQQKATIAPTWRSLGSFAFSDQSDAAVTLSNTGTSGYVIADAVQFILQSDEPASPTAAEVDQAASRASLAAAQEVVKQRKLRIKEHKAAAPAKAPEAMAPADRPSNEIADSPIHIRGETRNLGPIASRGFLQVCSSGNATIRQPIGSGRLELADWLTDPDNPIVARVFVNRVWMHLMGQGIVRTVDNFGAQGERPTHPRLLDALATRFVRNGWQLKPLIRDIVTSAAYQRSSDFSSEALAIDPENRMLWRMHRRRLPAESIRDTMLMAAGELDRRPRQEQMAGRGTLVSSNNADSKATFAGVGEPCRSLYLPTVRGYMPPMMTMLDVADPDMLVGRRPTTNVPAQALVLINSPEIHHWADTTATKILDSATGFDSRLQNTFLRCLQRDPKTSDRTIAEDFFAGQENSKQAWREYIAALFASTEFRILD
ncbi:MAG: DUF1553 domain-containing protein, partial [Pirellulaceae bacterium]|nr:DUF1553 domain-containing protein [Pirellulaceae bacterium]